MGQKEFEEAVSRVKTLPKTPPPKVLLDLYALFKQATEGDAKGARPGMLDIKGRAKFDAWSMRKGMAREQAMDAYVQLVQKLLAEHGMS
ncbi:MAG: acyl-CoA-binding protein [Deltaproteobacteria bacterium]|nr:acyl-CoA-binding protein [Deltaproteobacteria bacterium]